MQFQSFLNFNHNCPICKNPLHLYMQWTKSKLFKGKYIDQNTYIFFLDNNLTSSDKSLQDYTILSLKDNLAELTCSSDSLIKQAKICYIYFYFICNPKGIIKNNFEDYHISQYKACYYRSSILTELNSYNINCNLIPVNPDFKDLINKDESYVFKSYQNNVEKVYILLLDWETNDTTLYYYSVSDQQKIDFNFKLNIFQKTLPMLNKRPNTSIEYRDKLLSKFNNWILLS